MLLLLPFSALLACADPEAEAVACAEWPADATAPDSVVVEDSCGWWAIAVGDHLVANVYLAEPEAPCADTLGDGLVLNSDPIYSAMSNDAAKWTYDIVAESAGTAIGVDVACDDGTLWAARVDVE